MRRSGSLEKNKFKGKLNFFSAPVSFPSCYPKMRHPRRDRLSLKHFVVELQCEKKKLKFLFAEVTNICLAEA